MRYQIIWTPSAKQGFADILQYVESSFGFEAALKLLDKTESILENLQLFPNMFPASKIRTDYRKAVVTKHLSLIYRIK